MLQQKSNRFVYMATACSANGRDSQSIGERLMAHKTYYVETVDGHAVGDIAASDVDDLARRADAAYRENMDTFTHQCSFQDGAQVSRFFDNDTQEHVGWFSGIIGRFVRRP
jgi:hypothetical protein